MSDMEKKRVRRSAEERAAEVDAKIEMLREGMEETEARKKEMMASFDAKLAAARDKIKALETRKKEILSPKQTRKRKKTKKQKLQEIVQQAQKSGLQPEEIAELLGVQLEE